MVTSDAAVIGRVRAGDADAFSLIVERYHDRCARLAMRLLGDPDDAADAVQESFIRAYNSLDRYQERDRFGAWLMCIVANRCRSATHTSSRRAHVAGEWWRTHLEPETSLDTSSAGSMSERDHALAERLSVALSELPTETRTAVVRKYADEMTYEEIAAATGVGVSALKMRVARGSAQLRRVLSGAGVTMATVTLIFVAHRPRRDAHATPAVVVACDTLRSLMRDTLSQAERDTLFPASRCRPESRDSTGSAVAEPEQRSSWKARQKSTALGLRIFDKRGQ